MHYSVVRKRLCLLNEIGGLKLVDRTVDAFVIIIIIFFSSLFLNLPILA